jgi:hypothetical protein
MSYDLYFLDLEPGQSWEDAIEALEDQAPSEEANASIPPHWDYVVAQARDLLGEVSVLENPPAWEITHEPTAIQLSNFEGQWGMSVPYWTEDEAATQVMTKAYALALIVERATGLRAYDPQLDQPVAELADAEPQAATQVFNKMAKLFRR